MKGGLKSSYDDGVGVFLANGRRLWTARETMLKNEPHLVTFHERLTYELFNQPSYINKHPQMSFVISILQRYSTENARQFIIPKGARGVIVIVVGNGHGDTSSNPGRD